MEPKRKRARAGAATPWTLHSGQRLVGTADEGAAPVLVAAGERHVQLHAAEAADSVGKLLPFEGGEAMLQRGLGRFYVAYPRAGNKNGIASLLDAVAMEFEHLPFGITRPTGSIEAACVNTAGERVALVERRDEGGDGATAWRLWCWKRSSAMWAERVLPLDAGERVRCAFDAQFFSSLMLGPCLLIASVARDDSRARWALSQSLVAVEDDWALVRSHRQVVQLPSRGDLEVESPLRAFMSPSRRWLVLRDELRRLCFLPLSLYDERREINVPSHQCQTFDAAVADVAWRGSICAVLLEDGSLHLIEAPVEIDSSVWTLDIVVKERIHDRLRLSTLISDTGLAHWHRLQWDPRSEFIMASFASTIVRVAISFDETEDTTTSPVPVPDPIPREEACVARANPHRQRRRWLSQLQRRQTIEEYVGEVVTNNASRASANELVYALRLILSSRDPAIADIAFTLFGIALQRVLRRLGFARNGERVGSFAVEDLAIQFGITEMLIAQLTTIDSVAVRTIAEKVVKAPAFRSRSERISYYDKPIQLVSSEEANGRHHSYISSLTRLLQDAIRCSESPEKAIEAMQRLFEQLRLIDHMNPADLSNASKKLTFEIERQDAAHGKISPWLQLQALVALYGMACDALRIGRVSLNVPRLLETLGYVVSRRDTQLLRPHVLKRFMSCRGSNFEITTPQTGSPISVDVLHRLAAASGLTNHTISWCGELKPTNPYELLLRQLTSNKNGLIKRGSIEIINRCLVELASLMRSAPLLVQLDSTSGFTEADGEASIEEFAKLVFVSTAPLNTHGIFDQKMLNPTGTLTGDEIANRHSVMVLSRIVMHHARQLAASHSRESSGDPLALWFRGVFLFDTVWTSADQPVQDLPNYLANCLIDQDTSGIIRGRVSGLHIDSENMVRGDIPTNLARVLRAFATLVWLFWVRERAAVIKNAIDSHRGDRAEHKESSHCFGRLAALCALQLQALALYRDDSDREEIMAIQLRFLEAASEMNPLVTTRVLEWGFPLDSVSVRYHRRLRAIMKTADENSEDPGGTQHVGQYRQELRQVAHQNTTRPRRHESDVDADVFGNCCCDISFQRVVWALLQRRFLVSTTAKSENDKVEIKRAVQARPSSIEGLIMRHVVTNLHHTQRAEIEQQIERLRQLSTGKPVTVERPIEAPDAVSPHVNHPPSRSDDIHTQLLSASEATDTQPSFKIRDLNPRRSSRGESAVRSHSPKAVMQRGTSSNNVLKLLQLRKESQDIKRHQSAPRMVAVPIPARDKRIETTAISKDNESVPLESTKRIRHAEPVLPLRRDHAEKAELMLLSAVSGQGRKSVPLTRKSFRLSMPSNQSPSPVREEDEPRKFTSSSAQCTALRSTSMQTDAVDATTGSPTQETIPNSSNSPAQHGTAEFSPPRPHAEVAVQCQPPPAPRGRRHSSQALSTIGSRFPVYVDLERNSESTGGSFLHVARLENDEKKKQDNELARMAQVRAVEEDTGTSTAGSPANSEVLQLSAAEEDADATHQRLLEQRRQTYRSHYPPAIAQRSKSERGVASSMSSFTTLKSEMERMKAKLLALENTARELDDDFKVTHHKLEDMGKARAIGSLPVLDEIDGAISSTDPGQTLAPSTLGAKATRDMDDARHLLGQIEKLTATEPNG